jgi:hypothetical protein
MSDIGYRRQKYLMSRPPVMYTDPLTLCTGGIYCDSGEVRKVPTIAWLAYLARSFAQSVEFYFFGGQTGGSTIKNRARCRNMHFFTQQNT